jgi:hypothetical protein
MGDKCQSLVNMLKNYVVPWNVVYFLNSCETTSFSISILFAGIIYLVEYFAPALFVVTSMYCWQKYQLVREAVQALGRVGGDDSDELEGVLAMNMAEIWSLLEASAENILTQVWWEQSAIYGRSVTVARLIQGAQGNGPTVNCSWHD